MTSMMKLNLSSNQSINLLIERFILILSFFNPIYRIIVFWFGIVNVGTIIDRVFEKIEGGFPLSST
jgi:hypothetical protein